MLASYFCIQLSPCFHFSVIRLYAHYVALNKRCVIQPLQLLRDMLYLCFYVTISSCCFVCCQVRQVCINCGVCMGKYFCGLCKLFDDDVSKRNLAIVYSVCFILDVKSAPR